MVPRLPHPGARPLVRFACERAGPSSGRVVRDGDLSPAIAGTPVIFQLGRPAVRHYQAQKRRDGGSWYDYGTTTNTSLTRKWSRGHLYEVRVRARDNVGNWGAWQLISVTP